MVFVFFLDLKKERTHIKSEIQLVIQKFKGLSEVIKDNFRLTNYLDMTHEERENLDGLKTPKGIDH